MDRTHPSLNVSLKLNAAADATQINLNTCQAADDLPFDGLKRSEIVAKLSDVREVSVSQADRKKRFRSRPGDTLSPEGGQLNGCVGPTRIELAERAAHLVADAVLDA
jgi:hypothetical protein